MDFTEKKVLFLVKTRPYGTIMNFEAWRAAVGMFGMDHTPTMLFLGDGVYSLLEQMNSKPLELFKRTYLSFEGKIFASRCALQEREIKPGQLIPEAKAVGVEQIGKLLEENEMFVAF